MLRCMDREGIKGEEGPIVTIGPMDKRAGKAGAEEGGLWIRDPSKHDKGVGEETVGRSESHKVTKR
jgi:hypothetical protein